MERIRLAHNELIERLDTSPTVNTSGNTVCTVVNEQFNHMQMFIISDVVRKYNLTMSVNSTFKRPHPAVVITITDLSYHSTKGERQKDWEQNSQNVM